MDDVAIVGGGPAGAFAALLLARAGLRVRVFDRARFPRRKLCGDTLNPGACATLSRHLDIAPLLAQALPLNGMLVTGPGGVRVRGAYGEGIHGYALERTILDQWLLERAGAGGAAIEEDCQVTAPVTSGSQVTGLRLRRSGQNVTHTARLVIAADGRHSRLAFQLGLTNHAAQPRRWAIGAYFTDVDDLTAVGEMHVRRGHYIGVAPMPNGSANACLVVPYRGARSGWRDAKTMLLTTLGGDEWLRARFAGARITGPPTVLGPMAVDARAAGAAGLLLAGDAAGFVDPMTGDGLTFALRGAELAAATVVEVLQGSLDPGRAPRVLRRRRQRAFAPKWRFNRALRRLVSSPVAVAGATTAARIVPGAFAAMIRYAGDVRRH